MPPGRPGGPRTRSRLASVLKADWAPAFIALLGYTFAIISYRAPIGSAAIALGLLLLFLQKEKFRIGAPFVILLLLTAWFLIGSAMSPYASVVIPTLEDGWVKLLVIFFLVMNALRTRPQLRFFIVFFVACFAFFPTRGAIFNWVYGYAPGGRAVWNGEFANPNGLGALAILQLSLAAGLVVTEPKRSLVWWGGVGGLVVFPFLILMTASRGAFIGMALFLLLSFAVSRQKIRAVAIGTAGILAALMFAPPKVWERVGGLKNATSTRNLNEVDPEGSARERFTIWETAFHIISDHPIFGVGFSAAPSAIRAYAPELKAKDVHSVYITVLAESGPLGLALYLSLIAAPLIKADRVRRRLLLVEPKVAQQLLFMEFGVVAFSVTSIWGAQPFLIFFLLQLALIWSLATALEQEVPLYAAGAPSPRHRGVLVPKRS